MDLSFLRMPCIGVTSGGLGLGCWVLGLVHQHGVLTIKPLRGTPYIVMAATPRKTVHFLLSLTEDLDPRVPPMELQEDSQQSRFKDQEGPDAVFGFRVWGFGV